MRRAVIGLISVVVLCLGTTAQAGVARPPATAVGSASGGTLRAVVIPTGRDGSPGRSTPGGAPRASKAAPKRVVPKAPKAKPVWREPQTCSELGAGGATRVYGSVWGCGPDGVHVVQRPTCYGGVLCTPPPPPQIVPPEGAVAEPPPPETIPPEPDIPALIQTALQQVPNPLPALSPPVEDAGTTHVVGLPLFFSTPSQYWRPVSVTATDGFWVLTIIATPSLLEFDPGDGSSTATCSGPGPRVRSATDAKAARSSGCSVLYDEASPANDDYDARLAIQWTLSSTTNIDPPSRVALALPPTMTTSTNIAVPVAEIQPILERPH